MDSPSSPTRREMLLYHSRPKSSLKIRWVVLLLVCIVMVGTYYSLDIPAALHHQLQDTLDTGTSSSSPSSSAAASAISTQPFEFKFNLLFSVYSIPNTILPFFGGSCVDRAGASRSLVSFGVLALIGQILVALGGWFRSWPIMLAGRFVYGLGGENICVACSTVLNAWFDGGDTAFAFAISLATGRLGSVINNVISPQVANSLSTTVALSVGAGVNLVALVAAIIIGYVERREKRRTSKRAVDDMLSASLLAEAHLDEEPDDILNITAAADDDDLAGIEHSYADDYDDDFHVMGEDTTRIYEEDSVQGRCSGVCSFGPLFWLLSLSCCVVYGCVLPFNNVASGILLERNYFVQPPVDCTLKYPDRCTAGTVLQNVTDEADFNPSTDSNGTACPIPNSAPILPTTLNITRNDNDTAEGAWMRPFYVYSNLTSSQVDCGDPFWSEGCTANYCLKQDEATETAGRVMSIPYTISAILSPMVGFVVDKIGGRAIIATLASVTLIAVHTALAVTSISPVLPLIGQGVAYSLYAAVIWPSVPLTVRPHVVGTAFGTIMAIQNIGLTVFPLIIAAIHDHSGAYLPNVEWFFVACATCGTLAGLLLNIVDCCKSNRRLNRRNPKLTGDRDDVDTSVVGDEGAVLELDISSLVSHSTL
mmetsp:Transcript_24236/g.49999  ORF Transcript_24236/g.49999 Transcript_24236/m.49999 type:complete len:649 (-) Transcript_24236:69-2015(-)